MKDREQLLSSSTLWCICYADDTLILLKRHLCAGKVTQQLEADSQVSTVGIRAANMRNSMEKKRNPELLRTFLASFPIPRYNRPIRTPIPMWDEILRWVSTCQWQYCTVILPHWQCFISQICAGNRHHVFKLQWKQCFCDWKVISKMMSLYMTRLRPEF